MPKRVGTITLSLLLMVLFAAQAQGKELSVVEENEKLTTMAKELLGNRLFEKHKIKVYVGDEKEMGAWLGGSNPSGEVVINEKYLTIPVEELSFLLGHELAHVILGHDRGVLRETLSPKTIFEVTQKPLLDYYYVKFAREQEFQADEYALNLIIGKYNPEKAINLFKRVLENMSFLDKMADKADKIFHFLKESPSFTSRLERLKKLLAARGEGMITEPIIISSLEISPKKDKYQVGDILTAEFTIANKGNASITFDILTVGGRLNGECPKEKCPDFTWKENIALRPGDVYPYKGNLKLEAPGNYHFFTAYKTKDGWNTAIPTVAGITNTKDIEVAPPLPQGLPVLRFPLSGNLDQKREDRLSKKYFGFGADWTAGSKCGGKWKKHVGVDWPAKPGEPIYAVEDGVVKDIGIVKSDKEWGKRIVIHHKGSPVEFTSIYLHVDPDEGLESEFKKAKKGQEVMVKKGERIGGIADIYPEPDHLHFQIRVGSYNEEVCRIGALPQTRTSEPKCDYPIFPEKFIDPETLTYEPILPVDSSFLLGKWVPKHESKVDGKHVSTREFRKDGTLISTMVTSGRWEVKGADQIVLSHDPQFFPDSPVVETYQIEGDAIRDSFGNVLMKDKDAREIKQTIKGKILDKYVSGIEGMKREVKFKNDGAFLSTLYLTDKWKIDGNVVKVYTSEGEESPWSYEIRGEKIEVKLKDAPDMSFVPYVRASRQ